MTDADEAPNERISFLPGAPLDATVHAAKSRLREAPVFPELPADADALTILRAVSNVALQMNERERVILTALEHVGESMAKMHETVDARLTAIEARVASAEAILKRIDSMAAR